MPEKDAFSYKEGTAARQKERYGNAYGQSIHRRFRTSKKLPFFDGRDLPSEILRNFRRKERSDDYPLRTALKALRSRRTRRSAGRFDGRKKRECWEARLAASNLERKARKYAAAYPRAAKGEGRGDGKGGPQG